MSPIGNLAAVCYCHCFVAIEAKPSFCQRSILGMRCEEGGVLRNMVARRMNNQNDSSTKDENNSEHETPSALEVTGPKAEKHCSRAATEKGTLRDPMFWLLFCTFLATSGAAFFTRTMRIANRAYVYSTSRFIHYVYKPNGTDL